MSRISAPFLLWLLLWPQTSNAQAHEPIAGELSNELAYVLEPRPGRRYVAVVCAYDAGHRDDPPGFLGLSHLTERVMASGIDESDDIPLRHRLEAAGALRVESRTLVDRTVFITVLPANELDWALYVEAVRLGRGLARFRRPQLEAERRAVLAIGRAATAYGWRERAAALVEEMLFPPGHPYHLLHERSDDVSVVRIEHVQWFFQRFYAPQNVRIAVVGGFDPEAAQSQIRRRFGRILRSGREPEPPPDRPRPRRQRQRSVLAANTTDSLIVAWSGPPSESPMAPLAVRYARILAERVDELVAGQTMIHSGRVEFERRALASVLRVHLETERGAQEAVLPRIEPLMRGRIAVSEWARSASPFGRLDFVERAVELATEGVRVRPSLGPRARQLRATARMVERYFTTDRRAELILRRDGALRGRGRVEREPSPEGL